MLTLAFEGINGAGKSRVVTELGSTLQKQAPNQVRSAKGAGFDTGPRFNWLRQILTERETRRHRGDLSPNEIEDYQRDRIFRIAYRYLVRRLENHDAGGLTHLLIDRTPLMSWAYVAAVFPDSPYIDEVRNEALEFTERLRLDRLYVLEVAPATVFGRIVARHAKAHHGHRSLDKFVTCVPAPPPIRRQVREIAQVLIDDPMCTGKPFAAWDYMPYDEVVRQLETYRMTAARAARLLGFDWQVVDAERTMGEVLSDILASLPDST